MLPLRLSFKPTAVKLLCSNSLLEPDEVTDDSHQELNLELEPSSMGIRGFVTKGSRHRSCGGHIVSGNPSDDFSNKQGRNYRGTLTLGQYNEEVDGDVNYVELSLLVSPTIFDQLRAIFMHRPDAMDRAKLQVGVIHEEHELRDNIDWAQLVRQSDGELTLQVQDFAFSVELYRQNQ